MPTGGKRTALFPGAFRPPHAAHLVGLESLIERSDVDEIVIVVSNVMRPFTDGRVLDAEHVRAIWEIYLGQTENVRIVLAPHSAVGWVAEHIAGASVDEAFLLCAGERDLAAGDDRFGKVLSESRLRGQSIEIEFLPTGVYATRAVDMRLAFERGDRDRFLKGLPTGLSSSQAERVWELCEHGLRQPSHVLHRKFERQLAIRGCRVHSFGPMARPSNYWRTTAELRDGRFVSIKHAGDGPKAARPGEPRSAKPRKRLFTEYAATRQLARFPTRIGLPREIGFDEQSFTLIAEEPLEARPSLRQARRALGSSIAAQCVEASHQMGVLHVATRTAGAIRSSSRKDHEHAAAWLRSRMGLLRDGDPLWQEIGTDLIDASERADRRGFVLLDPDLDESRISESGRIAWRNFEVASGCGDRAFDLGTLLGRLIAEAIAAGEEAPSISAIRSAAVAHPDAGVGHDPWIRRTVGFAAAALLQLEPGAAGTRWSDKARGLGVHLLYGSRLPNHGATLLEP